MRKHSFLILCLVLPLVGIVCIAFFLPHPPTARANSLPTAASAPAAPAGAHILEGAIQPIPESIGLDAGKVSLGRRLFYDVRFSHDNSLSCASCHALEKGGGDDKAHSLGIGGAVGAVNAPTVLNSGLNYKQFWDGRADTLEDQVNGPIHNPKEMGSSWDEVMGKLRKAPGYPAAFGALYPDGIHPRNVRDAIATFERSLNTPDSPFDRYLRGDRTAMSAVAVRGYSLFKEDGCVSCHQGANLGGNMFQKFGVMGDYIGARNSQTPADLGRFSITGRERDRYVFRVPSLRNVALTAPYFHDGSAATLPQAVAVMEAYQLGRPPDAGDQAAIVAFLGTLTGRQPRAGPK